MMWFKYVVLVLFGFAGGTLVASGFFAFITMIGLVNRFAQTTKTAKYNMLYEECIIYGATAGNLLAVYMFPFFIGNAGCVVYGLISGIYAGCIAVALAEVIKAIPIFIKRAGITSGLGIIMLLLALGKGIGGIIYFFFLNQ